MTRLNPEHYTRQLFSLLVQKSNYYKMKKNHIETGEVNTVINENVLTVHSLVIYIIR